MTRVVRLLHLRQRDGDTLHEALKTRMAGLPTGLLRSITWVKEPRWPDTSPSPTRSARRFTSATPDRPGSVARTRNMDGLLRDYFPKGTDLSIHTPEHLLAVEDELNNRPRQVLNGHAPAELFAALLASKSMSVLRR